MKHPGAGNEKAAGRLSCGRLKFLGQRLTRRRRNFRALEAGRVARMVRMFWVSLMMALLAGAADHAARSSDHCSWLFMSVASVLI
jgi:hypothetical protein